MTSPVDEVQADFERLSSELADTAAHAADLLGQLTKLEPATDHASAVARLALAHEYVAAEELVMTRTAVVLHAKQTLADYQS